MNWTGKEKQLAHACGRQPAMVVHGIGTASEIDSRDNLLFLEDVGEYLYNTDRMMMQLKRAGEQTG